MADEVRLVFLGGLGEIGRNCAAIVQSGQVLLIDCGLMFPDTELMPGIDLVLPDFSWLLENRDQLVGCVLTHGHEDHVGALCYLLRELGTLDLYGSALTLGLAQGRLEEAGVQDRARLKVVGDGEVVQIGPFFVEFIPVTHSVPHGYALAVATAQGVILHTGDFKLDLQPVDGRRTDLARIGALGKSPGIRLLLSDSTNAEEPGYTSSETEVGEVLRRILAESSEQRVIVTCFASHIHRIQQIIDAAAATGRKVATLGRSMNRNVSLARSLGLLSVPDGAMVDIEAISAMPPSRVCVISTGSQGEPMSALSLMATGENKWLQVGPEDVVVISAHAVPGNESAVSRVIDGLARRGARVIHAGIREVHTSGHAKADELRTMLAVSQPQCFIPVHGEYRHLASHARIAIEMGLEPSNVLICEDGDVVELSDSGIDFVGEVPASHVYVDGVVGGVSGGVLRDRRVLAEEGIVVVVLGVDPRTGEVVSGPEITAKGWVGAEELEALSAEAAKAVLEAVAEVADVASGELDSYRRAARSAVSKLVSARTKRRPMVIPIVLDV